MTLDSIEARYPVILCDIWGCIHDGVHVHAGASERLARWQRLKRTVILVTNAPRTADVVARQLRRLGLAADLWQGIATAGDAGIEALGKLGRPVGFIGTAADRETLESRGVVITDSPFDQLACAGFDGQRRDIADYDPELRDLAARGVLMHCLNPDRVVIIAGRAVPCAGALADRYLELGGTVEWYGKPFPAIYRHAMSLAGEPLAADVLAIGDGLETDILGAARMGYAAAFVRGGINRGADFPPDFASRHCLGDWRPAAIVDSLL